MSTNPSTVPVRIRIGEGGNPVHLCHWPIEGLDGLIRTLDQWGYADASGNTFDEGSYGQFVISPADAYFEVIVTQGGE